MNTCRSVDCKQVMEEMRLHKSNCLGPERGEGAGASEGVRMVGGVEFTRNDSTIYFICQLLLWYRYLAGGFKSSNDFASDRKHRGRLHWGWGKKLEIRNGEWERGMGKPNREAAALVLLVRRYP